MPPTLYLIDGHALAYRTYFALSSSPSIHFTTRSGEPTAGIYGFASVLIRILEQNKPDYLAVAFDTGKTFRDDIYPAYKATRAKMPEDLRPQIERIRQMVDVFGFPRLEMEGFEADDVLAALPKWQLKKAWQLKSLPVIETCSSWSTSILSSTFLERVSLTQKTTSSAMLKNTWEYGPIK